MEEKLNEYKVNILVLQHDETPDLVHVDCSTADVAPKRLSDLRKRGFSKPPLKRDIFLREGASIHVRCSGGLGLETNDIKLSFASQLCRPVEFRIVPVQRDYPLKAVVVCSVAWTDLGGTEMQLLGSQKGDTFVDVSKTSVIMETAPVIPGTCTIVNGEGQVYACNT
jgi:hypothetical protein